jgi:hypothetical protein
MTEEQNKPCEFYANINGEFVRLKVFDNPNGEPIETSCSLGVTTEQFYVYKEEWYMQLTPEERKKKQDEATEFLDGIGQEHGF